MSSGLLDESQSAALAGVTPDTIRQYGEFGLLQPIKESGKTFYREGEIRTLFYTRSGAALAVQNCEAHQPAASGSAACAEVVTDTKGPNNIERPTAFAPTFNRAPLLEAAGAGPAVAGGADSSNPDFTTVEPSCTSARTNAAEQSSGEPPAAAGLTEANQALRDQIQMLREERDWLRQRIEKLESRSEREQMLLMSESETVRSLVKRSDQRQKSFWSFALPWFGFTEEPTVQRQK